MRELESRPLTINRCDIALRTVDVEHRRSQLILHVLGRDTGSISADFQVLSAQNRAVHGVIGEKSDQLSVQIFQSNQANLPVHRTIRVHSQVDFSIHVLGAAIHVCRGETHAQSEPRGLQCLFRLPQTLHQLRFNEPRVFRIGFSA